MLQAIGRWLFRLYLTPLAAVSWGVAAAGAAIAKLAGWSRTPFAIDVGDRLFSKESIVMPALITSFEDTYQHPEDGPGWSEQQIPRLWATCRQLAEKMGCPPPDAIHLSVEPGDCCAWNSKRADGPVRRHIALSLLDLRLLSHDEARAVIAHEIAHAGFDHTQRDEVDHKHQYLMGAVAAALPFPLSLPVKLIDAIHEAGMRAGAHDAEKEADRKAAEVVGGNHAAKALERTYLHGPVLARVFKLVLERALEGPRAPERLAEAAARVYASFEFKQLREKAERAAQIPGPHHPSLDQRKTATEAEGSRAGVGRGTSFIDAYPELLTCEELLTKTYFPDTPVHQRSDASQLRRKALATRLKTRAP